MAMQFFNVGKVSHQKNNYVNVFFLRDYCKYTELCSEVISYTLWSYGHNHNTGSGQIKNSCSIFARVREGNLERQNLYP